MILDERTEFADAVTVALAAGTTILGDTYDLGALPYDLGSGQDLWVVIQTDTSIITGGGAGTIQFSVVSDSLTTLGGAVVASCTLHLQTAALVTGASATGVLVAGQNIIAVQLPSGTYERYLGVLVTVATTTITAGRVNAFLTHDISRWYPTADAAN